MDLKSHPLAYSDRQDLEAALDLPHREMKEVVSLETEDIGTVSFAYINQVDRYVYGVLTEDSNRVISVNLDKLVVEVSQ